MTRLVDNDDTVLVDVRTASEYANNHIKSAINIPLSNLMTTRHDLNKSEIICDLVVLYGQVLVHT